MKLVKKAANISDTNDKDPCLFLKADIKKYVANLKTFLYNNKKKMTVAECASIMAEIKGWDNFFKMVDMLSIPEDGKKKNKK